ncbi:hypothetical protein JCM6882_001706 [Rhodosporidiobolus microsporus]
MSPSPPFPTSSPEQPPDTATLTDAAQGTSLASEDFQSLPATPHKPSGGVVEPFQQGGADDAEAPAQPRAEGEGESAGPTRDEKGKGKAEETALDRFSCHICLDLPEQPVVTPCGHMYCWPCMHEWLVISSGRACPVCKTKLNVEQLIPIYSAAGESDPRDIPLPPRPRPADFPPAASYRTPTRTSLFGASSGFTFSAGVFPLPGLAMSYSWPPGPPANEDEERERLGLGAATMRDPHGGARVAPEQEWLRTVMQQAFMLLFFAVFIALTFAG